ncbi:MAG: hypothetical protein A2W99_10865 [Bacteroidetes bacterium GWF2_33_16]|nr:MAG: hypothetical protein A2X00_04875 [Bacteroidetes bacterium GWE2_32_14]OFY04040.1 MAG: hypothetical protein A2W99_10865 [Bacteroidetes bacterium GWF2_33_16]
MLSICIPIYNYNVVKLVGDLHKQASGLSVAFEIILIDDFSDIHFKLQNESISRLDNVKYVELQKNIGRSKIRNLFLDYALFDNMLFLDCDAAIVSESFVLDYITSISIDYPIICGGLFYSNKRPEKDFLLRWKYGHANEVVSPEKRAKNPYKSFKTINFLIRRDVFKSVKFDERIAGYGHEDTWFGFQLKKSGVQIKHINNPVLHTQLETNEQFIIKTEQSIESLLYIRDISKDSDFEKEIALLKTFNALTKFRILFVVKVFFWIFKPMIRALLLSGFISINLFAFYKLGLLISKPIK